jgi:hypothetical protein
MIMKVVVVLLLLFGLPLLGVALVGQPVQPYLEFPPQTRPVQHAPFSWAMFVGVALLIALAVGPVILRVGASQMTHRASHSTLRALPWWGWAGSLLLGCSWVVAWNRFPWFEALQPHLFTPLWLGYILLVNALTLQRTGRCLIVERPRFFLALFPASAAFWWCFEYLNRFVQNWYYVGPHALTASEYFLQATVPFSTVLPAVLSTMELLASVPALTRGLDRLPCLPSVADRLAGWVVLLVASAGLAGIGIWPDRLFPLVWVAPLLVITAVQMLAKDDTIFFVLREGDGTSLWLAALAALVCGLGWEMWNYKSLVHWEYAIPSVHAFTLFEMPVLGYAGYLPFGLECLAVTLLVFPRQYRELMSSVWRVGREPMSQKAGRGEQHGTPQRGYFKV